MVKMTRVKNEINPENALVVGTDVSKKKLDMYSEVIDSGDVVELEDTSWNSYKGIEKSLAGWEKLARQFGYERLVVAAEATGGLEKRLLEVARRRGHLACYVSGEATSKSKSIESNDSSKSDPKDARIVFRLAAQRRTLVARELDDVYGAMRQANTFCTSEEEAGVAVKNEFRTLLHVQFPDLDIADEQLFGAVGKALAELFGFCAQQIFTSEEDQFMTQMLEHVNAQERRVMTKTLKKIFAQARLSAAFLEDAAILEARGERLKYLWKAYLEHRKQVADYKQEIVRLYKRTDEYPKLSRLPDVHESQLARLIAETGPLNDFASHAQLLRYLGMNLTVRQSGTYQGKTKLSKKGRGRGRKILYQLVTYCMIGKGKMLHEYYQRKVGEEKRAPLSAIVATMRKALKMLWGVARSNETFDLERVGRPCGQAAAA